MVPSLIDLSNMYTVGEFICEVETYGEPISQHNQLEVLGQFSFLACSLIKSIKYEASFGHNSFNFSSAKHLAAEPERGQAERAQGLQRAAGLQRHRLPRPHHPVAERGEHGVTILIGKNRPLTY